MLRATPGWRRMWPRRSSVRTIWCTEGGLSWKWRCMSVSAGGRPVDAGIGVDEGQVLPLPLGEAFRGHRHTIDSSAPLATERQDEHTLSGRAERSRAF